MLKVDKVRKPQARIFYILDYLWGGFATLGVVAVLLAIWQWGSNSVGEFLIPSPLSVFQQAVALLQDFRGNQIDLSLWRAIVGVSSALLVGIVTGLIAGTSKTIMAMLNPLMTMLLATPPIIWVVMALFWFGFGNASVLFTIIIIVTPLTFASSSVGIATLSKQMQELFDVHHLGWAKKMRYLYIPHLTSYIIASISVAVASGMRVVVMAELLGASDGVGSRIADARVMLDTPTVMAYVVLVILLVALFEYLIIKPLEILFMPWKR
ncbi:ABC transporter permease [Lonepinella sp. MS14435]|uniref:ABC transporter permease n=1 Tax=Lonepinella sp. MS14435 TaxID=3003618 RepID=UPI0036DBC749